MDVIVRIIEQYPAREFDYESRVDGRKKHGVAVSFLLQNGDDQFIAELIGEEAETVAKEPLSQAHYYKATLQFRVRQYNEKLYQDTKISRLVVL